MKFSRTLFDRRSIGSGFRNWMFAAPFVVAVAALPLRAWDSPGHEIVNKLALDSLPADFPAFAKEPASIERIRFLAGEPDRWSHSPDPSLKHYNWPDHYFDCEWLSDAGLDPHTVSAFRYEFLMAFAEGYAAHREKFPVIDAAKDFNHTERWPGFLPWTVTESFWKVKAAFASLKVYRELGTPAEIKNAEENVVYLMGTMGHYVGDLSQPLHTTIHHDGWVGENPHGYITKAFHTWIDSGLIAKAPIKVTDVENRVTPVEPLSMAKRDDGRDPIFVAAMEFMLEQNKLVEPLYQLELDHKLGHGDFPVSPEGRAFIENQLCKGGEMLGRMWLTAWRIAEPDKYLRSVLIKRNAAALPKPAATP